MTPHKRIVFEELGFPASGHLIVAGRWLRRGEVSVRKAPGGYLWIYITLPKWFEVTQETRERIEKRLVDEKLCGQYYTDYGPGDGYAPNVSWRRT